MPKAKIAPSMLSSDFANLASEAARMLHCGADWLHMDIMLNYVLMLRPIFPIIFSNILLGPFLGSIAGWVDTLSRILPSVLLLFKVLESTLSNILLPLCFVTLNLDVMGVGVSQLKEEVLFFFFCRAYLDCHLMVTNPLDYVEPLGKSWCFRFYISHNWQELVQQIRSKGMTPGVALKPGTPVEEVYPLLDGENPVEMVLVMTVEPGFGGQKFLPEMMDKVHALRKKYPSLDIEVDGGLGASTIDMAASAGANCIVAGSSVFGAAEPAQVISLMRKSVDVAQLVN
ncbi:aldolase-type TIM barrel family protein [Actinidia rufa]|uniref:ribulose-phosphate 3-epimerase n=1 Tax=Actinidia rufa TaxID=165716 RepID=A0A7J0H7X6_9ERIC|nr:aldolase-type TIM barrel family protein [Actinidia rufa]